MAILTRRATTKNLVAFSIRIPPDLKAKLEALAYENRKSLGLTVEEIITAAVENMEISETDAPRAAGM